MEATVSCAVRGSGLRAHGLRVRAQVFGASGLRVQSLGPGLHGNFRVRGLRPRV